MARPRPRSSYQDRAKRSTRLFSSFGPGSSSDKASPTSLSSPRSRPSNSTLGGGRDAPTTMTVKSVDPATREMVREKAELVTSGNLMDKIGRPDHSGWMRKRGEKYNTWKMRFFVLKGTYLYYLKSEAVRPPLSLSLSTSLALVHVSFSPRAVQLTRSSAPRRSKKPRASST